MASNGPILRTSGLPHPLNKVMYDITTHSVFDTFLGKAVTGPLAKKGVQLKQASVVKTEWGAGKAHPETTVLIEEVALGRDFDFRNRAERTDINFPIGDVDPRLPVPEDIVGIITASGKPVAVSAQQGLRGAQTRRRYQIRECAAET